MPQCNGWLDSDGVRLRGRGRAGVGSQGAVGQEGVVSVEALEKRSFHGTCSRCVWLKLLWQELGTLRRNYIKTD